MYREPDVLKVENDRLKEQVDSLQKTIVVEQKRRKAADPRAGAQRVVDGPLLLRVRPGHHRGPAPVSLTVTVKRPAAVAVDLFAGWGGFTQGAEAAGVRVVWAANHWPLAVRAHAHNHPRVEHVCQDLRQADWTRLPWFNLLLASPACQGHSRASQPKRRPSHDASRATAWAVVDCADVNEPENIIVENVLDFRRWRLYRSWCSALRDLGYHLQEHVVRATNHGVPQRRERLFIVGTRHGRSIDIKRRCSTEPAFGPSLEPGGLWRPVSEASPGAQERIHRGRKKHGSRFLTQHVTGHPGVPLHEPIRTITTKDQWAVVDGDMYRPLTVRELARAMGFSDDYSWPAEASRKMAIRGLGGAVPPPVATDVINAVLRAA